MNKITDAMEEDISLSDETSNAELEKEIPDMEENASAVDTDIFEMKDDPFEKDIFQEDGKISSAKEAYDSEPLLELSPKEHTVELKEIQKKEAAVDASKNESSSTTLAAVTPVAATPVSTLPVPIEAILQTKAPASLEVELTFVIGQQRLSLEDVSLLAEEKIITLGGADFQVKVMLQEKSIAEAQLVLVEGVPSLQITKIL